MALQVTASEAPPKAANDSEALDSFVARALDAMKANPARAWTVAALARVAGLSRAPFARRFRRATGTSPRRWLTEHRLGLARERLLSTDLSLAAISSEIGYASEFAFAKVWKREVGMAPGRFRRFAGLRGAPVTTMRMMQMRAAA